MPRPDYSRRRTSRPSEQLANRKSSRPSRIARKEPEQMHGERFTPVSYAWAIARTYNGHKLTHWYPYQLRHAAGPALGGPPSWARPKPSSGTGRSE